MGEVISIATQETAEQAWEEYRVLAAAMIYTPELLIDKHYRENVRRAERKWQRLFDRVDG